MTIGRQKMAKKILVTGGAGYIGSHAVKSLLKKGFSVIIIDNLSSGFISPIEILKENYSNLEFFKADLADKEGLIEVLKQNRIDTIMHFAAKVSVSESLKFPALYYQENYINSVNLTEAALETGVNKFIFSSSCVVYGSPKYIPIDENHPSNPESPYGQSKLDYERYLKKVKNLKYVIFRYFNVGGSDPDGLLGKSNFERRDLIANLIRISLGQDEIFHIYGGDYDTKDGTAIRDFLHVEDIVQAHILALEHLDTISGEIFNLGSESGFSVKEIIHKAENIFQKRIPFNIGPRRKGDIPVSVASSKKIKTKLGWDPKLSNLETIIKTDWNWRKKFPLGYNEK